MMWDNSWGAGQWVAMSLMMVAFWSIVVVAVIVLVRSLRSDPRTPAAPSGPDARRILDERFARGEMDAEDYAQRRDLLGRS